MIWVIPIIGLALGIGLAYLFKIAPVSGPAGQYLAIASLAGLDSFVGGLRAGLEKRFSRESFLIGFFSNIVFSYFLAWLGDHIYVNLFLAVALVLTMRIYQNLILVRRMMVNNLKEASERRRMRRHIERGAASSGSSEAGG